MKNYYFLLFCLAFFGVSCESSKKVSVVSVSTPLSIDALVDVIGQGQKVPNDSKLLGQIKIGESGMTATKNCTYARVLEDAQKQARVLGGNLIQIIEHKEPSALGSSCHRLKCDVYLVKK